MMQYHILLILVVATQLVDGFTITLHQSIKCRNIQIYPIRRKTTHKERILSSLFAGVDDDINSKEEDAIREKDKFDGKGFAGYLAPYAVALLGSIAVTAAFVKFVLLDY